MDTLLITAEKRYGMKKLRSCRMMPQPRKWLRSPKITTRDEDPHTDLGVGLVGTILMGLWCQPHDHLLEEFFGQVFRNPTTSDKIDFSNEETTRITTIIGIMTTEQTRHTSRTKINLGFGEVIITIHDGLQRHDKTHLSQISAHNPDENRLTLQCLTG